MRRLADTGKRLAGPVFATATVVAAILWFGTAGYARDTVARTIAASLTQYQYADERPGWGCGDNNHEHTGPPGAQYGRTPPPGCDQYRGPGDVQYGSTAPGWGCGDENHVHTGPPGRQYGKTPPPGCAEYRGRN